MPAEQKTANAATRQQRFKIKVFHKCLLLIIVPWAVSTIFMLHMYDLVNATDKLVQRHLQSVTLLSAEENFMIGSMLSAVTCLTYLTAHRDESAKNHALGTHRMVGSLKELQTLLAGQPERLRELQKQMKRTAADLQTQKEVMLLPSNIPFSSLIAHSDAGARYQMRHIAGGDLLAGLMTEDKNNERQVMAEWQRIGNQIRGLLLGGLAASILLTVGLGLYFYRSILERLRNVQHNIVCLNAQGTLNPPGGGTDEIADLDSEIHQSARQIRELQAYKAHIMSLVGRQFTAPLLAIDASLQNLKSSGALSERSAKLTDNASVSLSRLIRLANQLLDVDSIEEATFELKLEPVDLPALVQTSCDAVEKMARDNDITLETQVTETTFEADKDRLIQVLVNLLSNAIKFSPPHAKVSITAAGDNQRVVINVVDRGRGIPEEFQKRLFERFTQSDESDAADHKGFGLGLSITKSIINAHNGEIAVSSAVGAGTTWTISLPLARVGKKTAAPNAAPVDRMNWLQRFLSDAPMWKKGLLIVSLPLIVQMIFLGSIGAVLAHSNALVEKAALVRLVTSESTNITRREMHIVMLACLHHVFHEPWMLDQYNLETAEFDQDIARLQKMPGVGWLNTEQATTSIRKTRLWADKLVRTTANLSAQQIFADPSQSVELEQGVMQATAALDALRERARKMEDEQIRQTAEAKTQITSLIVACLLTNTLLAAGLSYLTWRGISLRIAAVMENARKLIVGSELAPAAPGLDEIAQIDRLFYASATRRMELEEFKQQLVAIIGHDLRTPLTTVLALFDMLAEQAMGALPKECVAEAANSAEQTKKLIELINEALDVEKAKLTDSQIRQAALPQRQGGF